MRNLVFALLACSLPVLLKLLLTGSIGSQFEFYFLVLWVPFFLLGSSFIRSWELMGISATLIIIAFMITILNYPAVPAMDFKREFVHHFRMWIAFASALILGIHLLKGPKYWALKK